jgi:hypothetical protein
MRRSVKRGMEQQMAAYDSDAGLIYSCPSWCLFFLSDTYFSQAKQAASAALPSSLELFVPQEGNQRHSTRNREFSLDRAQTESLRRRSSNTLIGMMILFGREFLISLQNAPLKLLVIIYWSPHLCMIVQRLNQSRISKHSSG